MDSTVNYTRDTQDFSLTETVADLGVNRRFMAGEHQYEDGLDNEKTFLWKALNELGSDISNTIYENVLNYINNVGNIDTCKVQALYSMGEVLGVSNNTLKTIIERMPDNVLRLLDLFSINRCFGTKYKVNNEILRSHLGDVARRAMSAEISAVEKFTLGRGLPEGEASPVGFSDPAFLSSATVEVTVPKEAYRRFITSAFAESISAEVFNTYTPDVVPTVYEDPRIGPDGLMYPVYDVLTDTRNIEEVKRGYIAGLKMDVENKTISALISLYSLGDFNPYKVADSIDAGNDLRENYNGRRLELLDMVLHDRAAPLSATHRHTSKYAFYHRKAAMEQLNFVNAMYDHLVLSGCIGLSTQINFYDIDPQYFNVTSAYLGSNPTGILKITDNSYYLIDDTAIQMAAEALADMSLAIADMREKLKTQAQRHYMRGSFLLISYIVSEYLKKNVLATYSAYLSNDVRATLSNYAHVNQHGDFNVNIIEYIDTTEYYNLSTDTSPVALSGNTVNYPFWDDDTADFTGDGLALADIDRFYLSVLNIKRSSPSTSAFLRTIWELGADRGYVDKRTGLVVTGTDVDEIYEQVEPEFEKLSAGYYTLSNYQGSILLTYGGTKLSFDPYYNWKNMAHGSYQIHPYLYKFVKYSNLAYAIRSSFGGDANEEVLEALKTSEISSIIGELGNIRNIWDRNALEGTGWMSRYQRGPHDRSTNYGKTSPVQHYDGVFYPSAIEDYMDELCGGDRTILFDPDKLSVMEKGDRFRFMLGCLKGGVSAKELSMAISSYVYSKGHSWSLSADPQTGTEILPPDLVLRHDDVQTDQYLGGLNLNIPLIEDYFRNISALHEAEKVYFNEFKPKEERDAAKQVRKRLLAYNYPRTFFDKWYSHLNLLIEDRVKIADRLSVYDADLIDIYTPRPAGEETYDIFRYGLDKYSNSLLLYKFCKPDIRYKEKQAVPGEMWLRTNGHPIGFPAFSVGELSAHSQIMLSGDVNQTFARLVESLEEKHQGDKRACRRPSCFYDFDRTDDYNTLAFTYSVEPLTGEYATSIKDAMAVKPWENPYFFNMNNENMYAYHWSAYTDVPTHFQFPEGEVFQGMFQNPSSGEILMFWTRWIAGEDLIHIRKVVIPDGDEQVMYIKVFTPETLSLEGTELAKRNRYSRIYVPFAPVDGSIDHIRLGYCGGASKDNTGVINLVFTAMKDMEAEVVGQNYIGLNTNIREEDTSLSSISAGVYGRMRYIEQTRDPGGDEQNSFDKFAQYLFIADFNINAFSSPSEIMGVRQCNLNSDASFIPLYEGLSGFTRIWAADFYRENKYNSIELLGPTFNKLKDLSVEMSESLYEDSDGTITSIDPVALLSSSFRVYEQYMKTELRDSMGNVIGWVPKTDKHYVAMTNEVLRVNNKSESIFSTSANLANLGIDSKTSGDYKILLYNMARGSTFPIMACDLSDIPASLAEMDTKGSCIRYLSSGTKADDFYLSNRYAKPYFYEVVGTPNVFGEMFDEKTAAGETNYIMGVDGMSVVYDSGSKSLGISMHRQDEVLDKEDFKNNIYFSSFVNTEEMLVDKNTLLLIVYDMNLSEFDTMHMMHHHLQIPFTSVLNKGHYEETLPDGTVRGSVSLSDITSVDLEKYKGELVSQLDIQSTSDPMDYISALDQDAEGKKHFLSIITEGSYSFKIGEQMLPGYRFPPSKVDETLNDVFTSINKKTNNLSQVFSLSNTYIFELQKPKEIADIMNELELKVYADDMETIKVTEDWVSSMYHVSKYETEFANYIHLFEEEPLLSNGVKPVEPIDIVYNNEAELFDVLVKKDCLNPTHESRDRSAFYVHTTEEGFQSGQSIEELTVEVDEENIKDFTKVYVNWAMEEDGINLYFNYNNYFNTPYSYMNSNGIFCPAYRPNTYLKLGPGQEGDLNLVIQLKYYSYYGTICGIKDVPILNYTIKNISDDKPKFSILNTWVTSTTAIMLSKTAEPPVVTSAMLKVNWTNVPEVEDLSKSNPLSAKMFEDYTTSEDISAVVSIEVGSGCCKVGAITADIVYEYTDENLEILQDYCIGGMFDFSKNGIIHVRTSEKNFQIGINLKKGTIIDEETGQVRVPIDAINFKAKTDALIDIDETYTQLGGAIFDFRIDGKLPDRFLAVEKRKKTEHGKDKLVFNGFEISETKKLIKIFQNKKYQLDEETTGGEG